MSSIRQQLLHIYIYIQEIMAYREEIAKLKDPLEMKQTIIKKQTVEIESVANKRGIYSYLYEKNYFYGMCWICTINIDMDHLLCASKEGSIIKMFTLA